MNNASFAHIAADLVEAGRTLSRMGMVPATSGNFSARLNNNDIAITRSGVHKGKMTNEHIMLIDALGRSRDNNISSAETLLHVQVYQRYARANAVLHVHSINSTVLSQLLNERVVLSQYELLKALPGVSTHDCEIVVPVFNNDQDIGGLADRVDSYMAASDQIHAYLIKGHGFYTWADSIEKAMNNVEALDFMFACELKKRRLLNNDDIGDL